MSEPKALTTVSVGAEIERVLIGGDLSKLSAEDRVSYYNAVCSSLGLNPLTKPFEYITLNGKLTLYARRDCTEQLRKIHGVSITIAARELVDDVYVVTAVAADRSGRTDTSIGAVPLGTLKGEAKANALMKAETKAKRRVTLSLCGLGVLDETEVDAVPARPALAPVQAPPPALPPVPAQPPQTEPRVLTDAEAAKFEPSQETVLTYSELWDRLRKAIDQQTLESYRVTIRGWANKDQKRKLVDYFKQREHEVRADEVAMSNFGAGIVPPPSAPAMTEEEKAAAQAEERAEAGR